MVSLKRNGATAGKGRRREIGEGEKGKKREGKTSERGTTAAIHETDRRCQP